MRLKDTIDFIGLWEILNNENFNRVEFDAFKLESGKNSFVMALLLVSDNSQKKKSLVEKSLDDQNRYNYIRSNIIKKSIKILIKSGALLKTLNLTLKRYAY